MNYLVHWRTLLLTAGVAATTMFSGCLSIRYIPAGGGPGCAVGLGGPSCGTDIVQPGCGVNAVAPGCGVDVVAPGCGSDLVQPGCGVDAVAPGCGTDFVEPGCGCNQGHGGVHGGYIDDYADKQGAGARDGSAPAEPVFARRGARFHPLPVQPVFSGGQVVQATAIGPSVIQEEPAAEPRLLPANDAAPGLNSQPIPDNGPFKAEPPAAGAAPHEEIPPPAGQQPPHKANEPAMLPPGATPQPMPPAVTAPPADGPAGTIDGPEATPAPAELPSDGRSWTGIPGAPPQTEPTQTRATNRWRVRLR